MPVKEEAATEPIEIITLGTTEEKMMGRTQTQNLIQLNLKYCWNIQLVEGKYQYYTHTELMPWFWDTETKADLNRKAKARLDELKTLDRTTADKLFWAERYEYDKP